MSEQLQIPTALLQLPIGQKAGWISRVGLTQSGEGINHFPLPGIEPRFLRCPSHCLFPILTTLFGFLHRKLYVFTIYTQNVIR